MSIWRRLRPTRPDPPVDPERVPWLRSTRPRTDGLNLVGYHRRQLGLGDAGRQLTTSLLDGGVPVAPLAFGASPSPHVDPPFQLSDRIAFSTTLAVVSADQMPVLREWHPEVFAQSDRMIGYCFWELSKLSDAGRVGAELLGEVWAATTFIASVFEQLGTIPVRLVPLPIPRPTASTRARSSFPPLADAHDRVVFGLTFDYFSVLERKNPLAAIDAFTRAFAPNDGPVLVIKTLNADAHPIEHARLVAAAEGRTDIRIWDAHLSDGDQFAFLGHLDVLVSLHRGEGLGKHLAEAMWLGVPCIATGYSGNLDFMDASCARLVGYELVDVEGGGTIYPAGTVWADPSVEEASEAMRELASEPDTRARLGTAAVERMRRTPGTGDLVTTVRTLLT